MFTVPFVQTPFKPGIADFPLRKKTSTFVGSNKQTFRNRAAKVRSSPFSTKSVPGPCRPFKSLATNGGLGPMLP